MQKAAATAGESLVVRPPENADEWVLCNVPDTSAPPQITLEIHTESDARTISIPQEVDLGHNAFIRLKAVEPKAPEVDVPEDQDL